LKKLVLKRNQNKKGDNAKNALVVETTAEHFLVLVASSDLQLLHLLMV